MISWFLSDLHIKDVNDRQSNTLMQFLNQLQSNPSNNQLFLVGDIFDFWVSNGEAFYQTFKPLVDQLKYLREHGTKIFYFEGNHDFHIDVFWTKKMGIPVFENDATFQVGSYKVRIEHGDFINSTDRAYLKYRKSMRKTWVEQAIHLVPGKAALFIGEKFSALSRRKSAYYGRDNRDQIVQMIRDYAKKTHQQSDFDLLVTGHMHVEDDFVFNTNTGTARSINLGTWLDRPKILKIDGDKVKMIYLTDKGDFTE